MDCSRVREILHVGVDGELADAGVVSDPNLQESSDSASEPESVGEPDDTEALQADFDQHLEGCALCAARARGVQNIKGLLRRNVRQEKATQDLRDRVLLLIEQEAAKEEAPATSAKITGISEVPGVVGAPRARRGWLNPRVLSGLAAAAVVAVALGYFLLPQALVHAQVVEQALRRHCESSETAGSKTDPLAFCAEVFGKSLRLPTFSDKDVKLRFCRKDRFGHYRAAHLCYTLDGAQFSMFVMDSPTLKLGHDETPPSVSKVTEQDYICQCANKEDYVVRCCHIGDAYICIVAKPESEAQIGEFLAESIREFRSQK